MNVCVPEFIPCMDKLFDESILIGSGYTARETLRYDGKASAGARDPALCQERLRTWAVGFSSPIGSRIAGSFRDASVCYVPWLNQSRCLDLHCR